MRGIFEQKKTERKYNKYLLKHNIFWEIQIYHG